MIISVRRRDFGIIIKLEIQSRINTLKKEVLQIEEDWGLKPQDDLSIVHICL